MFTVLINYGHGTSAAASLKKLTKSIWLGGYVGNDQINRRKPIVLIREEDKGKKDLCR